MRKILVSSASRLTDSVKSLPLRRFVTLSSACAFGVFWLVASVSARPLQSQSSSQARSSSPRQSQAKSSASATPLYAPTAKSPALTQPLTLAEAARQARAQHANEKSVRVFTNDDLSNMSGTISVVGNASNGETVLRGDAPTQATQSANGGNAQGEQYWRAKAQTIKDQIASIDRRIADEKAEVDKGGAVSFDPSTGLTQNVIIVHDRNADIKDLENQKADLEKQLDNLADACRQAGGDPGWVR